MGGHTVTACACALTLFVPPLASAQERPDPDSPAGVEYELPLEGARRDASGDPDRKTSGGKPVPAPLFGVGLPKEEDGDEPASGSPGGSGGGGGTAAGSSAAEAPRSARLAANAANDGGNTTLFGGGAAVVVLLGGALLGLVLRRRLGRSEAS